MLYFGTGHGLLAIVTSCFLPPSSKKHYNCLFLVLKIVSWLIDFCHNIIVEFTCNSTDS